MECYHEFFQTKAIAKELVGKEDKWDRVKVVVMTAILYAKFNSAEVLKNRLMETGDRPLLETVKDKFWGVNMFSDSEAVQNFRMGQNWGQNFQGKILMNVRSMLSGNQLFHGVPNELVLDQGSAFVSDLMLEICEIMGTQKINMAAHHQQSDSLCEHFNCTLLDMLVKLQKDRYSSWGEYLLYMLMHYRFS